MSSPARECQACVAITEPHAVRPDRPEDHGGAHPPVDTAPGRVKSLVPAAADAEVFIIAAQLNGKPALFIVESSVADSRQGRPEHGYPRRGPSVRSELNNVIVPLSARSWRAAPPIRTTRMPSRCPGSAGGTGESRRRTPSLTTPSPTSRNARAFGEPIARRGSPSRSCAPTSPSARRPAGCDVA